MSKIRGIYWLGMLLLMSCLMASSALARKPDLPTKERVTQLLASASTATDPAERIVVLSGLFLGAPYLADTLTGSSQETERLVINLSEFDCFTLLDVIEALRRSARADDFPEQLRNVRYRDGLVAYTGRRHFFSDWVTDEDSKILDVTEEIGQGETLSVVKELNRKADGTLWLPGVAVVTREITYIPTSMVNRKTLAALQSGDYVGIYSEQAGLDVSHTGLIVKHSDSVLLRHASSRSSVNRVVDEDLLDYLRDKPGLVVYRVTP